MTTTRKPRRRTSVGAWIFALALILLIGLNIALFATGHLEWHGWHWCLVF